MENPTLQEIFDKMTMQQNAIYSYNSKFDSISAQCTSAIAMLEGMGKHSETVDVKIPIHMIKMIKEMIPKAGEIKVKFRGE